MPDINNPYNLDISKDNLYQTALAYGLIEVVDDRIALLVDGDNIAPKHLPPIIAFCQGRGTLVVSRVYGDFRRGALKAWAAKIEPLPIEPVQQQGYSGGKNETDMRLAMDAGALLAEDAAGTYVLASGDGDMLPLIEQIRHADRQVIVIASKNNHASAVRVVSDEFVSLEVVANIKPKGSTSTRTITELIDEAFRSAKKAPDGSVTLSVLGDRMREIEPNYKDRLGKRALSKRLKKMGDVYEVRNGHVRQLREQTTPLDPAEQAQLDLLLEAYEAVRDEHGRAQLGSLGSALRDLEPNYKARFKGKKLSTWYKHFSHVFKVKKHIVELW